jgi:hypothetical protein
LDKEDVDDCLVNFRDLHEDILLHKFNVQSILTCFSLVDESKKSSRRIKKTLDINNPNGNNPKNGGGKCKSGNDGDKNEGKKKRTGTIENKEQVPEFKMKENETWKKYQGKCIESQAKFKDTYMCPHFHTTEICHVKCNFPASHIPGKDVLEEVKKLFSTYLAKIRQLE